MTNIDGLSSGLDTTSIINQLMQLERRPQVALTQRRDQETAARAELTEIRTEVSALRNLAADLRLSSGFDRLTASSSNEEAVSVQATSASTTGSYSFQVTSVASAASVYSTAVYASADDSIGAPGPSVFNSSGYTSLGFSSVTGTGFADGAISFAVTQSSEAAEVKGAGIPTIPITIDGTNDSVDVEVNGFSFSVTLAHDTYESEDDLADALKAGVAATSGAAAAFSATLTADNEIALTTKGEGSAHSITVTGGTALGALGLTAAATATGVDGIVELDGTATTITDTTDGTEVTLPSGGAGSITATLSGALRVGTATTSQSTSGSGSLNELVGALNAADLGYTAYAVNTGDGYRLQLTANETGADSAIDTDPAIFGGMGFTVLSAGTDAELTLQGENPFTIVSSDNTFDEILPGVAVTVNAVTDTPVTVSTERDVESVTESVNELVTKLNEVINRITASTSNQPDANRSVLQGNRAARRAAEELRNAFIAPMEDNAFTSVGVVGIELTREGTLNFNAERFKEAFLKDPASLTDLFANRTATDSEETAELGALDRLVDIAEKSTAVGEGYLYTAAQAAERRIDDYGRQIDNFERRMEIRESTLRRTYANLEVALGGLQQQSGYLASQLGSLGGTA
ncbi:MAG: flagellar filament capping protein FliD [Acidimicrobiales bacterium]